MNEDNGVIIPEELILRKIYQIRGQKIMLDMDLAELYDVETKQLKRAVRRNIKRFPIDFMFELTKEELNNLRSQFGTSKWGGLRYPPMAFSEQGVAMLSSVINSNHAILVNIRIIRIFVKMRELLMANKDIKDKFKKIEQKLSFHDENICSIFEHLKQLEKAKQRQEKQTNRRRIGY